MKKLFSVCLLILCLSFPVLGGHALPGGRYCSCNDPASHYQGMTIDEDTKHSEDTETTDLETLLNTLSMLLRVSF